MKNPLTPAGIEEATFRLVVQHLNHCATAVPYHRGYIVLASNSVIKHVLCRLGLQDLISLYSPNDAHSTYCCVAEFSNSIIVPPKQ